MEVNEDERLAELDVILGFLLRLNMIDASILIDQFVKFLHA